MFGRPAGPAEAVLEGAAILRRRSASRNWFRADRIPAGRPEPASDHVARVFRALDFSTELADDTGLLDETFSLVDSHRLEQELVCRGGGYIVESMAIMLDEGLGFRAGIDQNAASLIPLLDGTRPLREAVETAAHALGLAGRDADTFRSGALGVVRAMFELGFLSRSADIPPAGHP